MWDDQVSLLSNLITVLQFLQITKPGTVTVEFDADASSFSTHILKVENDFQNSARPGDPVY